MWFPIWTLWHSGNVALELWTCCCETVWGSFSWMMIWPLQIFVFGSSIWMQLGHISQQMNRIPSGNLYHSYGKITFSLYIAISWSIARLNHRRVSLGLENNLPICLTQRVSQRNIFLPRHVNLNGCLVCCASDDLDPSENGVDDDAWLV